MKRRVIDVIKHIPLIVAALLIAILIYLKIRFKLLTFEQLIYSVLKSEGTSLDAVKEGFFYVIIITIVFYFIFLIPIYYKFKRGIFLNIEIENWKKAFQIFPVKNNHKVVYFTIILISTIIFVGYNLGIFSFLISQLSRTYLFENYYVNPGDVEITFPENKQNLIYIYVESLETTGINITNGGVESTSFTPKIESLALNYTNFSNTNKLGGAYQVYGTGWTVAAMVAHTSGLPLKLSIDGNSYSSYGSFLPGAITLGDILEDNGYINYLMLGSDASFAGRNEYFEEHGNYKIFDYKTAIEEDKIDDDYYVWWGVEDKKIFEYAKEKLLEISSSAEPFNFSILTADTHFIDGYLDESCSNKVFNSKYANVFYCSDSMVYEFVSWIMEQDFYENTTIVLVGDHLTMQSNFYENIPLGYIRTVFNTFINSRIETVNNKNRAFSTLDFFPTTLASLGAQISGDRLGLGTNLYSDKKTLIEELGIIYFDNELTKKSNYYDNYILENSYYQMIKN